MIPFEGHSFIESGAPLVLLTLAKDAGATFPFRGESLENGSRPEGISERSHTGLRDIHRFARTTVL